MLYREIPFLRIGVPLCAGIITGLWFKPGNLFFILSGIAISILFVVNTCNRRNISDLYHGLILTLALWLLGLFQYTREKAGISTLESGSQILSGTISEFPEEKEKTFRIIVKLNSVVNEKGSIPLNGSVLLYHRKNKNVLSWLPGDRLLIRCTPVEITSRGNPYEFNYSFYMENQGIGYYSFTDSADVLAFKAMKRRSLIHKALIIRENIIDMFRQRGITGDRLALVSAITLGQKNMLDPEQKQYFMKAGVMHIMAVSGLHTVILSLFIFNVLFFMKNRLNILRVIITILSLWLFAFITGLTPSVLRATLMFSFLQAGKLMKRPVNGVNSVLASAFVLILFKPSVIFDAGFLLSYSAVIFIVCFYRDLYQKLSFKHRIPDLIWQSAAVTIIAQLGTLPLTVLLFNRFPVWFILSNIIIVPLSSLVVILGCIVPLTFNIVFLSKFLASILSFLTGLTEEATRIASTLPYATIENIGTTTIECIFLMFTIFLFSHFFLRKESVSPVFPLLALMCLTITGLIKDVAGSRSRELIVYNTIGKPVIGVRSGTSLNIYSDTIVTGQEVMRHYASLSLKKRNILTGSNPLVVSAGRNKILITALLDKDLIRNTKPDYIIITSIKPGQEREIISSGVHLKGLIYTSGYGENLRLTGGSESLPADTVHIVRKSGAFTVRL